ncbi:hypothetical protein Chor_009815 [Crotalus horridus]
MKKNIYFPFSCSISSTIMDVDSTISSGRSTPVMMNGQGVTTSSAKSIAYNCCWDQCHSCFNSSPDLADHIRSIHVDGQRGGVFVCLWKGCKVYNTPSTSQSWLQRHMLTHSGDKPFKCVVGGCNASFASQSGLARHVPTHFSQQNSSKVASQPKAKEESPSKAGMNKRKKLKNKRRRSLRLMPDCAGELLTTDKKIGVVTRHARPHDFFDAQTLDAIRHRAICFNLSAHIESLGKGHSVVFHSTVSIIVYNTWTSWSTWPPCLQFSLHYNLRQIVLRVIHGCERMRTLVSQKLIQHLRHSHG